MAVIFDLDLTLVDSSIAEPFRKSRDWNSVYRMIPQFAIYNGIPELIDYLNLNGITVGVVTSAPRLYCEKVIRHFQLRIPFTVCYHDTQLHKPHPEPLHVMVKKIGCSADACMYLGDDVHDIVAAKSASILSIACLWGAKDSKGILKAKPDITLRTPTDALTFFKTRF